MKDIPEIFSPCVDVTSSQPVILSAFECHPVSNSIFIFDCRN